MPLETETAPISTYPIAVRKPQRRTSEPVHLQFARRKARVRTAGIAATSILLLLTAVSTVRTVTAPSPYANDPAVLALAKTNDHLTNLYQQRREEKRAALRNQQTSLNGNIGFTTHSLDDKISHLESLEQTQARHPSVRAHKRHMDQRKANGILPLLGGAVLTLAAGVGSILKYRSLNKEESHQARYGV